MLILGIGALFAAGYFLGNVPIISDLLGTNEQRDLGVELSVESSYSGLDALNHPVTVEDLREIVANPQSFTSAHTTLTEEEVSSLLAIGHIPNFPFRTIQLDFGADGTVRSSGVLDTQTLQALIDDVGISNETIDKIMGYVKTGRYVNYYVKGKCGIINNQLSLEIDKLEFGRVPFPGDFVENELTVVGYDVTSYLNTQGFNIRKLAISDGQIELDLDRPLSSIKPWLHFVREEGR